MANRSDLMKAMRGDKNLMDADLSDAILSGADLSGANLEGTKMPEGWEFSVRAR